MGSSAEFCWVKVIALRYFLILIFVNPWHGLTLIILISSVYIHILCLFCTTLTHTRTHMHTHPPLVLVLHYHLPSLPFARNCYEWKLVWCCVETVLVSPGTRRMCWLHFNILTLQIWWWKRLTNWTRCVGEEGDLNRVVAASCAVWQVFVALGFPSSNVTHWMGVQEVVLWMAFAMSKEAFYLFIYFYKRTLRPYFSFQGTLKSLKRTNWERSIAVQVKRREDCSCCARTTLDNFLFQ